MKEYIEKAAIHELVKRIPKYEMFNYDRTTALLGINPDDVDFGVDKIPAADVVEVRRGHWINIGDYDMAECSECGEVFDVADQYAEPTKQDFKEFCKSYRYCPNCGCRMDLKENDHEVG